MASVIRRRLPTGLEPARIGGVRGASPFGAVRSSARRLSSHSRNRCSGSGGLMWKPCARSQPRVPNRSSVRGSSTPSATTSRLRLCPRSIVERTIVRSSALVVMPEMNDRSILISRMGRFRR